MQNCRRWPIYCRAGSFLASFKGQAWYDTIIGTAAYGRITLAIILGLAAAIFIYILLFKTTTGYRAQGGGHQPGGRPANGHADQGADHRFDLLYQRRIGGRGRWGGYLGRHVSAHPWLHGRRRLFRHYRRADQQLHPLGVLLSALFFAALRAGGNKMQMITGVPTAVVGVIQELVILFVVASVALDLTTRIQKAQMARHAQTSAAESVLSESSSTRMPILEPISNILLSVEFYQAVIRMTAPVLLAAMGGLLSNTPASLPLAWNPCC